MSELDLTNWEHVVIAFLREAKKCSDKGNYAKAERFLECARREIQDLNDVATKAGGE
jgi:hypothetical protein